jgi:DNA-binding NtrC family response regulator
VLVVDDDATVLASLRLLLAQNGYRPLLAATPDEALELVGREPVALALCDMNFSRETSGREGLDLLARLRERDRRLPVILITAWGSIELAVEGMKAGAADFVTKPWSNEALLRTIRTVLEVADVRGGAPAGAEPSRVALDQRYDLGGLVGRDPAFLRMLELAGRVARTDASVLVTGESGTGKELVAEVLHRNSRRRRGPFVKVNLGGISSTLFESEMFGHVRGAFTDARADRRGRFELAHGGTIFLDEIGELDPSAQVKLLRVLQDRTYEVLGSSTTRTVDVRVVSATNRDLPALVRAGEFREDLYFRLNLIVLRLPPLRERRADIPLLAHRFLGDVAAAHGRAPLEPTADALDWLAAQPWPGNVRELRHALERAALVLEGRRLDRAALAELESLGSVAPEPAGLPEVGAMTLEEIERTMIVRCLDRFSGNLTRVAAALGLSRPALYRRLRKHGLEPGDDARR